MENVGKKFESSFKLSVPEYCYLKRLNDQPQSFVKNVNTKFSLKNPFDYLLFDCKRQKLWAIECKTTKYKSLSIAKDKDDNKMIKYHQIKGLSELSKYNNVIAGFLINFRTDGIERTYFQKIEDFNKMIHTTSKSSVNEIDLIMNHAIKINGKLMRVNYRWDIESLLESEGN